MNTRWKIARRTLTAGALLLAAGCAADAEPTDTGSDSLIGSTLGTVRNEDIVVVGQQLVFFQAGPSFQAGSDETFELGSSLRGASAPLTLVGDDPVKGPIRAAEALVSARGKAFTIVSRSLTRSGPRTYEIVETDGTLAGTSRRPVARTGKLLGCGEHVYLAGMRVEANGDLTKKPKLEPGYGGHPRELCFDGSYVFGVDGLDALPRRYYRWEKTGSLSLLREDNPSTYLTSSGGPQDEPAMIGERFLRSGEEVYPGPYPKGSAQWNAWMHDFRTLGVVKTPAGESRLLFTDYDPAKVYPIGSGWGSRGGSRCLWITDGTVAGTERVEGSCDVLTTGTFTTSNGLLVGYGLSPGQFWTSDGTSKGTLFHPAKDKLDFSVVSVTRTSDDRAAVLTRSMRRSATGSYDVTLWTVNVDGTNLVAAAPPKPTKDGLGRPKLVSFDGGVAFSMPDENGVFSLHATEL